MNCRHDAVLYANRIEQRFDQRCQAIRRARRIGYNRVARLEHVVIDAINDRGIDVLAARCRDDHFLRAGFDVFARRIARAKKPRRLENDIDAEFAPGQLSRIAFGQNANAITIHDHVIAVDFNRAREATMCRIATRQMRVCIGVAKIVNSKNFDFRALATLIQSAQDVSANSTVAVNTNLDCHTGLPKISLAGVPTEFTLLACLAACPWRL